MRLNASIPALLALVLLFFLPVSGAAKTPHRRAATSMDASATKSAKRSATRSGSHATVAHRSAHGVPARVETVREASRPRRRSVRRAAVGRGHAQRRAGSGVRQVAEERSPEADGSDGAAAEAAPQKATSADFLAAADAAPAIPAAIAIHGTAASSDGEEAAASPAAPVGSASAPIAVVSVIRPVAERPQLSSVEEEASTPVILPSLYNKRGRLILPRPLKGSREILLRQNEVADRDGLHRIQNDDDLVEMRKQRLLVALPTNGSLEVDERLPEDRRYCRPWTAQFLASMARAHYAQFHRPLQINSAVRTAEFQQHLMHINGNAAPAEGDTASPHLTGQAVDIAKHGLTLPEIAWMRGYLLPLVQEGKVDVEEEFQQSCFHISVYKKYSEAGPRRSLALKAGETSALATAIR